MIVKTIPMLGFHFEHHKNYLTDKFLYSTFVESNLNL